MTFTPGVTVGTFRLGFENEGGGSDGLFADFRLVLIAGPNGFLRAGDPPPQADPATRGANPAARGDLPLDQGLVE